MSAVPVNQTTHLADLKPGTTARITGIESTAHLERLAEMGLIPGQMITLIKRAPLGDPIEVHIMNYNLCIRLADARAIQVEVESRAG